MQRIFLFAFSALVVFGLTAPHAQASPVTYHFTGHIIGGAADPLFPPATLASTFDGSFTFDSSWVDSNSDPTVGVYSGSGGPYGITINMGGGTFRFEGLDFLKFDNASGGDGIRLEFFTTSGGPAASFEMGGSTIPVYVVFLSMGFVDSTGSAFSSDALLPLAPFSSFDDTFFGILLGTDPINNRADYRGKLDSLTPTLTEAVPQIPVPAALPLFLTSLGCMGLLAWRRKHKASAAL